jgi:hypothetical protein
VKQDNFCFPEKGSAKEREGRKAALEMRERNDYEFRVMGIARVYSRGTTEREYYEVVSGSARDEIAVTHSGKDLLLRPIFIENGRGEREILCYVPQNSRANDNEPFTGMVCELLQAGVEGAFSSGEVSGSLS